MICKEKCVHYPVCFCSDDMCGEFEKCVYYEEKRPHGEWEYTGCVDGELQPEFCCSICDFTTYFRQYRFCPMCGATMEEGETE